MPFFMIKADAKLPPRKHFFSATQQPLIKKKKLIAFLSLVGAKRKHFPSAGKNLASPREARFLLVSLLSCMVELCGASRNEI